MRKRPRKRQQSVGHDAVLAWEADFSEEDGRQFSIDQHSQKRDWGQEHVVVCGKAAQEPTRRANKKARKERKEQLQQQEQASNGSASTQQTMQWKPFLLFDLNGVLVSERTTGKKRRDTWEVRPGIEALLQLREKYTIGVFSSATAPTVRKALERVIETINDVTGNAISKKASHCKRKQLFQQRAGMPEWLQGLLQQYKLNGMKGLPWYLTHEDRLFQVVLTRNQCKPDPTHTTRPDGNPWDTVKPLHENGFPINRVLLVDNELRKAGSGEQQCMLLIPTWERCQDHGVGAWKALVNALLELPTDMNTDLRETTQQINTQIAAAVSHETTSTCTGTAKSTPTGAGLLVPGVTRKEEDMTLKPGVGMDPMEQSETLTEPPRKLQRTANAADVQTAAVVDQALSVTRNRYQMPVVTSDGYLLTNSTDIDDGYGFEQQHDEEALSEDMDLLSRDNSQSDSDGFQSDQSDVFNSDDDYDSFSSVSEVDIGIGDLSDDAEEEDEDIGLHGDGYDQHELEQSYQAQPGHKRGRQLSGAIPLYNGPRNPSHASSQIRPASQQLPKSQAGATRHHQLSGLHYEIARFAAQIAPNDETIEVIEAAVNAVQAAAQAVWPTSRAVLFGSQACGVALPGSDLDVVVLGAIRDVDTPQQLKQQKHKASKCLGKLIKRLRQTHILESYEIIPANVPIIKAKLRVEGLVPGSSHRGELLAVDIGIGAANGVAGASLMQRAVLAAPWLRPLCLVIKALLKSAGLNEVFTAGLSSWGVINMVLAHLQCEQLVPDQSLFTHTLDEDRKAVHDATQHQQTQAVLDADGNAAVNGTQHGHSKLRQFLCQVRQDSLQQVNAPCLGIDLGDLLISFLYRLGFVFNPSKEMISVRRGGVRWLSTCVTQKGYNRLHGWQGSQESSQIVFVEDPQQAGRNACAASPAWPLVRVTLRAALQRIIARNRNEDPCVALPLHLARVWAQPFHSKGKQKHAPKSMKGPHLQGPITRVGCLGAALYRACTMFGRQRDVYFCRVANMCETWSGWASVHEPPPLAMQAHNHTLGLHHHTQQHQQHQHASPSHQPWLSPQHTTSSTALEAQNDGGLTEQQLWEMVQQDGSHHSLTVPETALNMPSNVCQSYPQLDTLFDVTAVLHGSAGDKPTKASAKANRSRLSANQQSQKVQRKQKAAFFRLNNQQGEALDASRKHGKKGGRREHEQLGSDSLVPNHGQKQNKRQLKIKAAKKRRVQAARNQRAAGKAARQQL